MEEQKAILNRSNRQLPNFFFFFNWKTQINLFKRLLCMDEASQRRMKVLKRKQSYKDFQKSIYICICFMTLNQTARIVTFKSTWEQTLLHRNFWLLSHSRTKISLSARIAWAVCKMNTNTKFMNKDNSGTYTTLFSPLPGGIWSCNLKHIQIMGMSL